MDSVDSTDRTKQSDSKSVGGKISQWKIYRELYKSGLITSCKGNS